MDPTTLPGMPAPFWFVQFFKIVGFVLHMIPMGLWFAGLPVAILCALRNGEHSRFFARRMFGQFPIIMALGINFGIVPLLFLQTTYYKSFYTATVLMGWHWLAVIPILIVGYYALYLAAFSRGEESGDRRSGRMILFGVIASLSLIAIGILITNGLTLMVRSDLWPGIMERTNHFGATTGLANNMRDPAVWYRLATMFALGLMTTGVWAAFDAHFLVQSKSNHTEHENPTISELTAYRRWTVTLAEILSCAGLFLFLTLIITVGDTTLKSVYPNITKLLFPICFLLMIISGAWFGKKQPSYLVIAAMLLQFSILAAFGVIRQIGQNAGVARHVDVSKIPTDVQWTPLIAFLLCFVLGLGVIAWMLRQCMTLKPEDAQSG